MGLTQEVGRIWNVKIVRRVEIDTTWMQQALEVDTETIYPKNRIAAVFHRFIKAGCAEKGKTRSSYKKLRNFKPRRVIPKLTKEGLLDTSFEKKDQQKFPFKEQSAEPTIDLLTLGKSIDALISDFKNKITELRKQLSEEKKTVGELVEQKRELEELYKKAQTRILELNTGSKGKSISLSALQNFRDELPE